MRNTRKAALILAVATMAFCSQIAVAQALTHDWAIQAEVELEGGKISENETFSEFGLSEESLTLSAGKSFKMSVPGLKSTLECKKTEGSGALVKGGSNSLKAALSSCKILENESCKVTEPLVFTVKTELVLVGNSLYEKIVPLTEGKALATLQLTGALCTLPKESAITGAVAAEMPTKALSSQTLKMSEALTKKVNEGLTKESKAEYKLKFGEQTAFVEAELLAKLAGAHSEAAWLDDPVPVLCQTAGVATCPAGKSYAGGTTVKFESEAESKFTYEVTIAPKSAMKIEVACKTVKFEGTTSTTLVKPRGYMTVANYEECGGCSVAKSGNPYFRFTTGVPLAPGNGELLLNLMKVKILCQGKFCEYDLNIPASPITFSVAGGAPAKAEDAAAASMSLVNAGSDPGVCSATGTWQGVTGVGGVLKFKFPAPNPLYVTF